jgi:pimeloyl-ACP methyl ester carboxylesterase
MPTVQSNGIELTYEERGEGEPLVLICGIGMQLVSWPEPFLEKLAKRGYRVIVFDNRDVGLSSKLDAHGVPRLGPMLARTLFGLSVKAPYTLFDMAADVAGLLDAIGLERAHVAGVSLGGMVAQATAAAHGGRLKSLVSLMSHSGGKLFTGKPSVTTRLLRAPPRSRAEAVTQQIEFFRAAGSTGFARDEVALADRAGRAYDRCFYPPGFARQFAAVLATGDMRPRLESVRVPTLVVHGTSDGIFRAACGRETAAAIQGATFRLIEGWGHDLAEGAADVLVDAIVGHTEKHVS